MSKAQSSNWPTDLSIDESAIVLAFDEWKQKNNADPAIKFDNLSRSTASAILTRAQQIKDELKKSKSHPFKQ